MQLLVNHAFQKNIWQGIYYQESATKRSACQKNKTSQDSKHIKQASKIDLLKKGSNSTSPCVEASAKLSQLKNTFSNGIQGYDREFQDIMQQKLYLKRSKSCQK